MSKALSSYPKKERDAIVMRRLRVKTKGLGYWAARDYLHAIDPDKKKTEYVEMTDKQKEDYKENDMIPEEEIYND
jgi:hypothetical protein